MRSRRHLSVLAIALLASLAAAGPAQASGGVAKLLTKFQPVLVFHPGEELRPTTVESFVRDSSLEAATSPTTWVVVNPSPSADALPATTPPVWRLNQRACFAGAPLGDLPCYAAGAADEPGVTVYARRVRDDQRIVLQYWLFYYDNLYRYPFLPLGTVWQSHEGDWEVVNVVLSRAKRPLSVGLSQHCSGEARRWSMTSRLDGHPIAYVALGSHANYFEPGTFRHSPVCWPRALRDVVRALRLRDRTGSGRIVRPLLVPVTSTQPSWMQFAGKWGESGYVHFPNNPPIAYDGAPRAPAFQETWRRPVTEELSWPPG